MSGTCDLREKLPFGGVYLYIQLNYIMSLDIPLLWSYHFLGDIARKLPQVLSKPCKGLHWLHTCNFNPTQYANRLGPKNKEETDFDGPLVTWVAIAQLDLTLSDAIRVSTSLNPSQVYLCASSMKLRRIPANFQVIAMYSSPSHPTNRASEHHYQSPESELAITRGSWSSPTVQMPNDVVYPTAPSFCSLPLRFVDGQFTGKTIQTQLCEIQKADLGRKYARSLSSMSIFCL